MKQFYFIVLLLLLGTYLAAQPVADNNGATMTANITPSITISNFNVPANDDRLLVSCTLNSTNAAPPTVTFGGNPMTLALSEASGGGLVVTLYYLTLSSSGSSIIGDIVAMGSGNNLLQLGAASYHNVDQVNPIDGITSNEFSGVPMPVITSNTLSIASAANKLVCDCIGAFANNFNSFAVDAAQTQIFQSDLSSPRTRIAMSTKDGAASVDMIWAFNGDFTNGTGGHVAMSLNPAVVLPVELTYFKGQATKAGNQLFWQTASERNNAGFEIQHSKDGQHWKTLAFVKGHGTTVEVNDYLWLDERPLPGANYYRLKQVDTDGTFEYSTIVQVSIKEETVQVFPNPVSEVIHYQVADLEQVKRVQLFDATGKLVKETTNINGQLSLKDLPKGVYLFILETANGIVQQRIVKE